MLGGRRNVAIFELMGAVLESNVVAVLVIKSLELADLLDPLELLSTLGLANLVVANGSEERLQVEVEVILVDAKIPIEEEEKLLLHEVDLGEGKSKVLVAANGAVASPMLVLRRRVIQVLRSQDQGCEEDSVNGAAHTLGDGW